MLAGFGVTLDARLITNLADVIYSSLDFGLDSTRRYGHAKALPPLSSISPGMQPAFRAVANTKPVPADPSQTWDVLSTAMEVAGEVDGLAGVLVRQRAGGDDAILGARLGLHIGEVAAKRVSQPLWSTSDHAAPNCSRLYPSSGPCP